MMKRIDAAYSQVSDAPLRFCDESSVTISTQNGSVPACARPDPYADEVREISPTFQRLIDYGTRFVCGAVMGVAIAFGVITRCSRHGRELTSPGAALAAVAVVVGCGLAAVFFGDNFWALVGSRRGRWMR